MHTDGIGVERHHGAVDCHHLMLAHHAQHARRHFGRIGDHCIRQTARHQRAVHVVRAVGERLVEHTKPGLRGQAADHGTISADGILFTVSDVQKNKGGKFMHYGRLTEGTLHVIRLYSAP